MIAFEGLCRDCGDEISRKVLGQVGFVRKATKSTYGDKRCGKCYLKYRRMERKRRGEK